MYIYIFFLKTDFAINIVRIYMNNICGHGSVKKTTFVPGISQSSERQFVVVFVT